MYISIVNYVGMSAIKKYVVPKKVYKCNYNAWKIMATSKLFKHCTFHQFQLKYIERNLIHILRFWVKDVLLSEVQ